MFIMVRCPDCDTRWVCEKSFVNRGLRDVGGGCDCLRGVMEMPADPEAPGCLLTIDERSGAR